MKCSNCKTTINKFYSKGIKYFCSKDCMNSFNYTNKPLKVISKKKIERLTSQGSESELFKKRFKQLETKGNNFCCVTGKFLREEDLSPSSFAHMFPKGKFPEMRYMLNNIALVKGIEEHKKFDELFGEYKRIRGHDIVRQDILNGNEIYKDILFMVKGLSGT